MQRAPRLGVSACLLGQSVRYDGGHKRNRCVVEWLGSQVEWVPVCPELEAGLGVPRPPMRLVREAGAVRLRETASGRDHTLRMRRFAAQRLRALRALELSGYVLKKDSPSCGLRRVAIYTRRGLASRTGSGLFAAALLQADPNLPIEEEDRLGSAALREHFLERVFAYRRVRELFRGRWTHAQLVAFHDAHATQLRAHSARAYRELGRLLVDGAQLPRRELRRRYLAAFMRALSRPC